MAEKPVLPPLRWRVPPPAADTPREPMHRKAEKRGEQRKRARRARS